MVENTLMECVGKSVGRPGVWSLDDRLVDIGFDSLRFIQLVVQLEAALGVEFADEDLDHRRFTRLRDISRYVDGLTPSR